MATSGLSQSSARSNQLDAAAKDNRSSEINRPPLTA
jgi:hypothetical protein